MKLKTLKDCKNLEEARQEAIKRCKYYRDRRDRHKESKCWFWIHHRLFQEFRDFFNITEENLK